MNEPMSGPSGTQDGGEMGEAASAALISDVLGGDLVYQHTPGEGPHGLDLSWLDDSGELHAGETKTVIGENWHQPNTSFTRDGRQMDDNWVAEAMTRSGVEVYPQAVGDDPDQVHTDLFQVDYVGDTIAHYGVNHDGSRSGDSPDEIFSLSDVLDVHEATGEIADMAAGISNSGLSDTSEVDGAQ
jgi:hypothetical protein